MDRVEAEFGVRVHVLNPAQSPKRERFYNIEQIAEQFYKLGHADAQAGEPAGLGKGWTIAGISIDAVRRLPREDFRRD